jgi:quercetin dioxygenase-like cupin family protein
MNELEKPTRLIDLIEYQNKKVINKILLEKWNGRITLFAFDSGQSFKDTVETDTFAQILEGEIAITILGATHRLKEGESIIMPSNKPHHLKSVKRTKIILTMIKSA